MEIRPKTGQDIVDINARSGGIGKSTDYILKMDPSKYYYKMFKDENKIKVDNNMYAEAARRGEIENLAYLLNQNKSTNKMDIDEYDEDYDVGGYFTNQGLLGFDRGVGAEDLKDLVINKNISTASIIEKYGDNVNYDDYMLALKIDSGDLDNTVKKKRVSENGYEFGEYTDLEWAISILQNGLAKADAKVIEQNKKNQNFFQTAASTISSFALKIGAGISRFVGDVFNVGEGLINIFVNVSNDDNIGARFLYAWTNDDLGEETASDVFGGGSQLFGDTEATMRRLAGELDRKYSHMTDAEKSFAMGFTNIYESELPSESYNWIGKAMTGVADSIGYMLPSMIFTGGMSTIPGMTTTQINVAKGTGSALFYTGIFSGNIDEVIKNAELNGITYKQLNAGAVISNAAIKAGAQWAIEFGLGKILNFFSYTDKFRIPSTLTTNSKIELGASRFENLKIFAKNSAKSFFKEGLEESLQDLSDGIIDSIYGKYGPSNLQDIYNESSQEKLNLQNLIDSFILGGVTEGIMSGIANLKYLQTANRGVKVDANGNITTMSFLETVNFQQAMETLNEWYNTLNDPNSKLKARQEAGIGIATAMSTIGSVIQNMGMERAIKANNILMKQLDIKAKNEAFKTMSSQKYANNLYNTFQENYAKVVQQYIPETLKDKIVKGISNLADKLKKDGVSEIKNIVTKNINPNDPNIPLTQDVASVMSGALSKIGAEALIGTDGQIVMKSEDIVFVPNRYLEEGNFGQIVSDLARTQVRDSVISTLDENTVSFLKDTYQKITGINESVEVVVDALLYDKQFYTKSLLLAEENNMLKILNVLSTIDKGAKKGADKVLKNGEVSNDAYTALMNRIYKTLRTGLVTYATQYVRMDFNKISLDVIPQDLRDEINRNISVLFTDMVNEGLSGKLPQPKDIERFDIALKRVESYATKDEIERMKSDIRSGNQAKILDAWSSLLLLTKTYADMSDVHNTTKITYLVAEKNKASIVQTEKVKAFENYFGCTIEQLKSGDYNPDNLTPPCKQMIMSYGVDMNNPNSRKIFAREMMFRLSNGTYTLDANYQLLKVITKNEFLDKTYLDIDGEKKFVKDLKSGKIKTLKDVVKNIKLLPKYMRDIEINYDPNLESSYYKDGELYISLGSRANTSSLMHELTHLTQYIIKITNKSDNIVSGGSATLFASLPLKVSQSLNRYINDNFNNFYTILSRIKPNADISEAVYYLLHGEIEANTSVSLYIPAIGFTLRDNGRTLVSPLLDKNGNEVTWDIGKTVPQSERRTLTLTIKNSNLTLAQLKSIMEMSDRLYAKRAEKPKYPSESNIIKRYGVSGIRAQHFVRNLIQSTASTWSQLLNDIQKANIDTSKLSETDLNMYNAGIDWITQNALYEKNLTTWKKEYDELATINEDKTTRQYYTLTDENKIATLDNLANKVSSQEIDKAKNYVNSIQLYKGTNTSGIKNFDNTKGEKLRIIPGTWFTNNIEVAKSYSNVNNQNATIYTVSGQDLKNPLVIDGNGQPFSRVFGNITSDDIASYAYQKGYDSLILQNIQDLGPYFKSITNRTEALKPSIDVVIFDNNFKNLSEKNISTIISEDKPITPKESKSEDEKKAYFKSRHISNKRAEQSNLKYWIQKGVPIQMDPNVANFVEATTKDFNKLPIVLKNKIKNHSLTKFDISRYVATASNIDDYTFKSIAKYVYNNQALADITFKEMKELAENIEYLATLAYVLSEKNVKMTPSEINEAYQNFNKEIKDTKDTTLKEKWLRANKKVQTVKIDKNTYEAHSDAGQLTPVFFRHYDGTLESLRDINNIGKYIDLMQQDLSLEGNISDEGSQKLKDTKVWNWVDKMVKGDIEYVYDKDTQHALDNISRGEKLEIINDYLNNTAITKATEMINNKSKQLGRELTNSEKYAISTAVTNKVNNIMDKLETASDELIDNKYLLVLQNETNKSPKIEAIAQVPLKEQPRTKKNIKNQIYNVGNKLAREINNRKTRYNLLSPEVKEYFDPNKKYSLKSTYNQLSEAELANLVEKMKADYKLLSKRNSKTQIKELTEKLTQKITKKLEKEYMQAQKKEVEKKTIRQKLQIEYKTTIKEQNFDFKSTMPINDTAKQVLNTSWDKTRMSTVQALSNNQQKDIANGKQFFEQNASTFMNANLNDIEYATKWFLQAVPNNFDSEQEYLKYKAVKMYFLSYVFSEAKVGGIYSDLNSNLKTQIENAIKADVSASALTMAVWNNMLGAIKPLEAMKNADMIIDGVNIPIEEKTALFDAISTNDIKLIKNAHDNLIKYVMDKKTNKKSLLRTITAYRSVAMLSSPLTMLRNKVANMALKTLNKFSSKIGNKVWTKHYKGQYQLNTDIKVKFDNNGRVILTGNVTPQIQEFINKNFIDNKFFDDFVSNLSKYNPNDISPRFKDANGKLSREGIMSQIVLKAMYNQYYNENTFKSKLMNQAHQFIMKGMSDDSYVREAAVRYFGKILAENNYDLSSMEVTDNIANDFSTALGLALSDYMHSDNIINKVERLIQEKSEVGYFVYKLIMPYGASSWNWFKEFVKYSPIGLAQSIVKLARLEQQIQKAETQWDLGKSQLSPVITEYKLKRDFGAGVIGTISFGVGLLLAGLGFIDLEDDDYGNPKLRIGNLKIDISSIFGTSSLLAGAALITGFKDKGLNWDGLIEALNRTADVMFDSLPLMEIIQLDMFSRGGFDMITDNLSSIALSFIPNIVSWIAGATYKGNVKKNTFFSRAAAKIPFLGNVLEKKVDPYTGEEGDWWDTFNRVVPYFSYKAASENERKTNELGLNKIQLRGEYKINGEDFNISGKDLTNINKAYGKWNAIDLEAFYNNKMSIKIKVNNKYKNLTYNQMTVEQRKSAVETIMSNNAETAKILAWTTKGNKYYASAEKYQQLRNKGLKENIYRGTLGFVKK